MCTKLRGHLCVSQGQRRLGVAEQAEAGLDMHLPAPVLMFSRGREPGGGRVLEAATERSVIPMHGTLSGVVSNSVGVEWKVISGAQPLLPGRLEVCRNCTQVYCMRLRLLPADDSPPGEVLLCSPLC